MQKRDQVILAALVIGLLVGAVATYALAGPTLGRTRTLTSTALSTSLIMTTITSTLTASSAELYRVTFNETGGCDASPQSPFYFERWYVTMDNITLVQPSNVTVSQINNQTGGRQGQYQDVSTIVFTVPDGNYSYYASNGAGGIGAGFVNVNGSDKDVPIVSGPYCP